MDFIMTEQTFKINLKRILICIKTFLKCKNHWNKSKFNLLSNFYIGDDLTKKLKNSLMTTTFLISKIKLYNSLIHVKIVLLCSEFQKILPFAGISASPPTNKSISSTEP